MFEIENSTNEINEPPVVALDKLILEPKHFHSTTQFHLDKVQFQTTINYITIVDNILTIFTRNNIIKRIDLTKQNSITDYPFKFVDQGNEVKIFTDNSTKHTIISTNGQNFYLFHSQKKPHPLIKLKGIIIESIAWLSNPNAINSDLTTGIFLIGSKQGHVFECELQPTEEEFFSKKSVSEKQLRQVFSLNDKGYTVNHIHFEKFLSDSAMCAVFLTTTIKFYLFIGKLNEAAGDFGIFDNVFNAPIYSSFQEIPNELNCADFQYFYPLNEDNSNAIPLPKRFSWLTGAGVYTGHLNFDYINSNKGIIENTHIIPYPSSEESNFESPIALALTEFHFIFLYRDKVKAVNILNYEVVYEEEIILEFGEVVLGLRVDYFKSTFWVFTNLTLYELIVSDEDRDVWNLYLKKNNFEDALKYAKNEYQRDLIYTSQAEFLFSKKLYKESAVLFAKSYSISFEEICLKFIKDYECLKLFLLKKLEGLKKSDITQSSLISTWLVEIYINMLNEVREDIVSNCIKKYIFLTVQEIFYKKLKHQVSLDVSVQTEIAEKHKSLNEEASFLQEEFRNFLSQYHDRLDTKTAFNLITTHGNIQDKLFFAKLIGEHDVIISHRIEEKNFKLALEELSSQGNSELYYKYSTAFMEFVPHEIVDLWMKVVNLNPRNLVPALLKYDLLVNSVVDNQALRYLEFAINYLNNMDPFVHNFLLSLYVKYAYSDNEASLLNFLESETKNNFFDLQYALRLCHQENLLRSCINIYGSLNMFEQAVDLSLKLNDLELARIYADKPDDNESLSKRLWLKIARYVVEDRKDIKKAMEFLKVSDILKIEDILPFFPDFVLINDFKEEIEQTLEEYNMHIEELKFEMDEATKSSENIRLDIRQLRNKHVAIPITQRCHNCSLFLLTRKVYIFPCGHSFHADCLISMILKESNSIQAKKVLEKQKAILSLTSKNSNSATLVNGSINTILSNRLLKKEDTKEGELNLEQLKEQLDELVASECCWCGDLMIKNIDKPFINYNESETIALWAI
ncbi:Vacuolar protein sorting-associated protein 18 like protein [Clydaea vesicula]|uniref:Vacuolar protein sorting-associated protein 18 like protein n=1 Tax=Clydaea vesicula TaxID=447962 RepID=A0AAD5U7M1_9FUNG|nr:Vacuolar protein sorting-associated protein 18 like protein [Clydaea vesicula]